MDPNVPIAQVAYLPPGVRQPENDIRQLPEGLFPPDVPYAPPPTPVQNRQVADPPGGHQQNFIVRLFKAFCSI